MGANIFQTYLQPPRSVIDYQNDYAKADQLRNNNALQALTLQQQQAATAQSLAERNALQRIAAGWDANTTADQRIGALRNSGLPGLMQQADTLETQNLSRIKTGADAAQATAHAGLFKTEADQKAYDLRVQKANKAIADISALGTPQEALSSLQQHRQAGDIDEQKFQAVAATIPPDQAQFPQWRKQMLLNILDAKTQLEMTKPIIQTRNTGGTTDTLAVDPITGKPTVTGSVKNTQSPDNAATTGLGYARLAEEKRQADQKVNTAVVKPMPATAVKLENEELTSLGTFKGLDADLAALEKQIEDKTLKFGPTRNAVNTLKNAAGFSDTESRNLATFKAKLENMRNAVLLLNKGVQTEGDAQRAMNEIMSNINDPELVKQRLGEIRALNKRAAELRKNNVDLLRTNYGQPQLDYSKYENQPAAVDLKPKPAVPTIADIDAEIARRRANK